MKRILLFGVALFLTSHLHANHRQILNASNLTSGVVPNARLDPSSVTLRGQLTDGTQPINVSTVTAINFIGNGSLLTGITSASISSGTYISSGTSGNVDKYHVKDHILDEEELAYTLNLTSVTIYSGLTSTSGIKLGLSTITATGGLFNFIPLNGVTYTWPATDGSNGQVIKTDGNRNLTWNNDNNSGSGGFSGSSGTIRQYDIYVGTLGATGVDISTNLFTNAITEIKSLYNMSNQTTEKGSIIKAFFTTGFYDGTGITTIPASIRLYMQGGDETNPSTQTAVYFTSTNDEINLFGRTYNKFVFDFKNIPVSRPIINVNGFGHLDAKIINSTGLADTQGAAIVRLFKSSGTFDLEYSSTVATLAHNTPGLTGPLVIQSSNPQGICKVKFDKNNIYPGAGVALITTRNVRDLYMYYSNDYHSEKAVTFGNDTVGWGILGGEVRLGGTLNSQGSFACLNAGEGGTVSTGTFRNINFIGADSTLSGSGVVFGFGSGASTTNQNFVVQNIYGAIPLNYTGQTWFSTDSDLTGLQIIGTVINAAGTFKSGNANSETISTSFFNNVAQ